jgi:outer membrane lipoprotein-sorting protein
MSILVSTLFPLFLSGLDFGPKVPPVAPPHLPATSTAIRAPATKAAVIPAVVTTTPAVVTPRPAVPQGPVGGELILAQNPLPTPSVAAPPSTSSVDRNAVIDRVSQALSETRTASGQFSQIDPSGGFSSGAFYISRPGKVRFEYTSPEPMFIISDGVSVSVEEPKRKSYDAVPLSSTPLNLFLRSNVDLKRDGSVADVTASNGSTFVTLVDKTGEAQGKMILEFRSADFELLGWRAIDGDGAETKVALTDTKKNANVKPSLFIVRDPSDRERR